MNNALCHEVGHTVANEIFRTWQSDPMHAYRNTPARADYLGLYGKTSADDNAPWAEKIDENFAEDFAHLYVNKHKQAAWKGASDEAIGKYISTNAKEHGLSLVKDVFVSIGGSDIPVLGLNAWGIDDNRYFVSSEATATVRLDGFMPARETWVSAGDKMFRVAPDETARIELPEPDRTYAVKIGYTTDSATVDQPLFGIFEILRISE